MSLVEARRPDGTLLQVVEVTLSRSGLTLFLTDDEGHEFYIDRNAWEPLMQAVSNLFLQEEEQAKQWLKEHPE